MAHFILSYADLKQHPKVARLAKLLGISKVTAIGHLHYLWWWCMSYAPDGDLTKFSSDEIADGGGWEGDGDQFRTALEDARFIDVSPEGLSIHDWDQYGGKLLAKKKADLARKSTGSPKDTTNTENGIPSEIQRNSTGVPSDVARRTEQNRTEKNRTEESTRARVGPPPLEVFLEHTDRLGIDRISAEKCWHHHESHGWPENSGVVNYDSVAKKWNLGNIERARNAAPLKNSRVPQPEPEYEPINHPKRIKAPPGFSL